MSLLGGGGGGGGGGGRGGRDNKVTKRIVILYLIWQANLSTSELSMHRTLLNTFQYK